MSAERTAPLLLLLALASHWHAAAAMEHSHGSAPASRQEPITVGVELEDPGLQYPNAPMTSCRTHVAKTDGLSKRPDDVGMIVGADVYRSTACDLEIRSLPMLLGGKGAAQMGAFFELFQEIYANPTKHVDGLKQVDKTSINPQLTISVPLQHLWRLVDEAPLIQPYEEASLAAFKEVVQAADAKLYGSEHARRELIDTLAGFLAFYLAPDWEAMIDFNVNGSAATKQGVLTRPGGKPTTLTDIVAVSLTSKMMHSLFIKEVTRDGVAMNGVVDLYWLVSQEMSRGSRSPDFERALEALLRQTLAKLSAKDPAHFGAEPSALQGLTHDYLDYLAAQAEAIRAQGRGYAPTGSFLSAHVKKRKLGSGSVDTIFLELQEIRDQRIQPCEGQTGSVYLEERRLSSLLGGLHPALWSKDPHKAEITSRVGAQKDKGSVAAAVHALETMLEYYRGFFASH